MKLRDDSRLTSESAASGVVSEPERPGCGMRSARRTRSMLTTSSVMDAGDCGQEADRRLSGENPKSRQTSSIC